MPQMSSPIPQTSHDTEREGRLDKIRKNRPQPSPKQDKQETHRAEKTPTGKLGKRQEVEKTPPKVQENDKKKYRVQPRSESQLSTLAPRD